MIQLINRKAETLFDYSREELLGQTLEMLLPEGRREKHVMDRARYFAYPQRGRWESARSYKAGVATEASFQSRLASITWKWTEI